MSAKSEPVIFDPPADPFARVAWAKTLSEKRRKVWVSNLPPRQAAEFFEAQAEDLTRALSRFAPHAIENGTESDVWLMKQVKRTIASVRTAAQHIRAKHGL